MPCYDGRSSPEYIRGEYADEIHALKIKCQKLDAMLCGFFHIVITDYPIDGIDRLQERWNAKETGIPWADVQNWWRKHCDQDRKRRRSR
jgi:hypothetical protein